MNRYLNALKRSLAVLLTGLLIISATASNTSASELTGVIPYGSGSYEDQDADLPAEADIEVKDPAFSSAEGSIEQDPADSLPEESTEQDPADSLPEESAEQDPADPLPEEFIEQDPADLLPEKASDTEFSDLLSENIPDDDPGDTDLFKELSVEDFSSLDELYEDKAELNDHLEEVINSTPDRDYVENEVVAAAPDMETAQKYAEAFGGELLHYEYGYALIGLDPEKTGEGLTVEDAVLSSADAEIMLPAVWPNYRGEYVSDEYPEDEKPENEDPGSDGSSEFMSYYGDPLLNSSSAGYQWQHYLLQSESAWRAGYTGAGVNVAVLDSGVLGNHEDLSIKQFAYYDETGNKLKTGTAFDENGHGTHCTGLAGARGNEAGGRGVAPEANIYVASISDSSGSPNTYATFLAINYASINWKCSVISMSLSFKLYTPNIDTAVENAYQRGTAVFCAAGNDASDQLYQPASCKHAISVGAVNQGNARTHFSNLNSKVRYSGPGYRIYSTYNDGGYTVLDGTSQATPCIAGVAAVILSSGQITQTGSARVDQLLSMMDKCCVRSGVGKGTPDLSKLFGTGSMTTAPTAPVCKNFTKTHTVSSFNQPVNSENGTVIYYTLDGSRITFKDGVVSENARVIESNTGSITISGSARVSLHLLAVNQINGLGSKEAIYDFELQPPISSISLSGPNNVTRIKKGCSAQITAGITPAYAKNQKLLWEVVGKPSGISVTQNGKVTVAKTATAASFEIRATSTDGSNKSAKIKLTVTDPNPVSSIKPSLNSVKIYTGDTTGVNVTTTLTDKTVVSTASYVTWKSSDETVSSFTSSGNKLTINGIKAGTVTLSGVANDGGGKTCTIKITVLQKVTGIQANIPRVAAGKNVKPKVTVSPETASNKKLKWELYSVPGSTTIKDCGVTVNASTGQINAGRKAVTGSYKVKATALDKGTLSKTFSFTVISEPIKKLQLSSNSERIFRTGNSGGAKTTAKVYVTLTGGSSADLAVSSNAEGIATAAISGTTVTITATGYAVGNAVITVATTDGSNLKQTVRVSVVNPVTRLYLSLPAGRCNSVQYKKSVKLIPTFVTESGPIDNIAKKLKWSSSNNSYLTVDQNGTVKAVSRNGSSGTITITARTTDGSNLKAEITLYADCEVTRIVGSLYTYSDHASYNFSLYANGSNFHGMIGYSISGPAGGLTGDLNGNSITLWPQKKGAYTVTIYLLNGGGARCSKKLLVR